MITYLEGNILLIESDYLVVKTIGGIGYQVYTPKLMLHSVKVGSPIELYTHTNVREDELSLYGFSSMAEKQLFELLIKTSGVGPKLAIAILSTLTPLQLIKSVTIEDINVLSTVPGVGKKTAIKLCLDMKDSLKKHALMDESAFGAEVGSTPSFIGGMEDLISALVHMGFNEKQVLPILQRVRSEDLSFEEQIKKALKLLTSV